MRRSASSPSIPGSHTSSSTQSTRVRERSWRPASAVSAEWTRYPSSDKTPSSVFRMFASSSITSTECRKTASPPSLRMRGELDLEDRPPRIVVADPHRSAVVGGDRADDRQPEPGSPLHTGEVGLEETVSVSRGHPGTVVGDGDPDQVQLRLLASADPDPPLPLAYH